MLDKEIVRRLYLKGLSAKEISKRIDASASTVQKCINRNFNDDKETHQMNKKIYKETITAVNKMNKSFISDSELLKMNRQSYKYDKNYNLIFNEERGLIPNDVPKKIKRAI